jgi:hypothetical protein
VHGLSHSPHVAESVSLPPAGALARPSPWLGIAARLTRFFTWSTVLTGCDGWISRLYTGGVRVLFTPTALTFLADLAAVGLFAFIPALFDGHLASTTPGLGEAKANCGIAEPPSEERRRNEEILDGANRAIQRTQRETTTTPSGGPAVR